LSDIHNVPIESWLPLLDYLPQKLREEAQELLQDIEQGHSRNAEEGGVDDRGSEEGIGDSQLQSDCGQDEREETDDGLLSADELFHRKLAETSEGIIAFSDDEDTTLMRVPHRVSQTSDASDTRCVLSDV
jgi:hypothetical protein